MARRIVLFPEDDVFIPQSVNRELMKSLFTDTVELTKSCGRELLALGWRFFVVDQSRGRCYYREKVITIPAFAFPPHREHGFKEYYICHEMSHVYAWMNSKCYDHGPNFMKELIRICPPEFIHHEIGYKPRNAIAAGISKDKLQNQYKNSGEEFGF